MNGSYQLLKFLSRVCCRLSDRSAVKWDIFWASFLDAYPQPSKKLALRNIFRGNITKDVKRRKKYLRRRQSVSALSGCPYSGFLC